MDAARYDQIHRAFSELRRHDEASRERELDRIGAEDPDLRDELVQLLEYDDADAAVDILTVPPSDSLAGTSIGSFRLLRRIGEGGFGEVYLAEQGRPLRRQVAVKILKTGMDARHVARFEAERQALAMMDHPHIARVIEAGTTGSGRPYFVMEYVPGLAVDEYCDRNRLTIPARLGLFAQICLAVQYAHQLGIIHRDLKPSNVIVSTVDGVPIPKVIDFGVAKATGLQLSDQTIVTREGTPIGTPQYMSPEQIGGAADIDTRTDVYSLGVLLYALLTGTPPIDRETIGSASWLELLRAITETDPPAPSVRVVGAVATEPEIATRRQVTPSQLRTMIRGELDWIVLKALERDRARRYDSAASLARDVHRVLAGEAVDAAPRSRTYVAMKFVRRNRGPVLGALIAALSLVGGLIGTSLGLVDARREKRAAERSAYRANMLSAGNALAMNQQERAAALLGFAPPGLRGWEWHVLEASLDKSVRTVTLSSGALGEDDIVSIVPLPDGRSIVTVHRHPGFAAHRWDAQTGEHLAEYAFDLDIAGSVVGRAHALSPDGDRLYAVVGNEGIRSLALTSWDMATGEGVKRSELARERGSSLPIAVDPTGSRAALSLGDEIWLEEIATGEVLASRRLPFAAALRSFNRDGTMLAAADGRGALVLLEGLTLEPIASLEGHRNMVADVDFSQDGRRVGSAALDGAARVWDLSVSPPSSIELRHPQAVSRIRLSPDASLAATMCGDGAVRVWKTSTGELEGVFPGSGVIYDCLAFMPDGRTVATVHHGGVVKFWDVTAESTRTLDGHHGLVTGASFAEGPGLIVSTGWDGWTGSPGCIRFWDADSGEPVAAWGEPGEIARQLAVSPDGRRAAATISARRPPDLPRDALVRTGVVLIDLETGRCSWVDGFSESTAFDPTGERVALSRAGRLEVRSAVDGSLIVAREVGFDGKSVGGIRWSPGGRHLVCASAPVVGSERERTPALELLEARSLRTIRALEARSVAFSPDGDRLVLATADGVVRVQDIEGRALSDPIPTTMPLGADIRFNRDGTRIVTHGRADGEVIVWDATTFDQVASFRGPGFVSAAAWNRDGTRLIAASGHSVCLWEASPLSERVWARDARRRASGVVTPIIERQLAELGDPEQVADRVGRDEPLDQLQRKVVRQELLRLGLAGH